jgi:predicted aminopeptidase
MKNFFILSLSIATSSCQMGYYIRSAHNQFSMMSSRVSITEAFQSPNLNDIQKQKILLSQKARVFAFENLKLKRSENYSTYIDLKRPFVTWVVNAAEKWEMKNYEWNYPIIGAMPYKGYFSEAEAKEEKARMEAAGYDAYMRGVSAYSTMGWFQDSLLSSMLRYKDHDVVNTIIHELVHTTIYIKSNSDFNERLAVFIGNKGTELFYKDLEGENSTTLKLISEENQDDQKFSQFISTELSELSLWYQNNKLSTNEDLRQKRLQEIISRFETVIKPNLKTTSYDKFTKEPMSNARMGLFKTYMENLDDFEIVYVKYGSNLVRFIEAMKQLEDSKNPQEDLKKMSLAASK